MKTNQMKRVGGIVATLLAAVALAGCSDGERQAVGPSLSISPPSPLIIEFSASPATIKSGESSTISWEVAGADSVAITALAKDGSSVAFSVSSTELKGTATAKALTSTTDFTLTATKSASTTTATTTTTTKDATTDATADTSAPTASSTSQTITVTVTQATKLAASITADSSKVTANEKTVIRWTVSPTTGVSVKVEADSGEAIAATDKCTGTTVKDVESQTLASTVPAVGCAVVAPSTKTKYTVTATDSLDSKNTASANVEVDVGEATLEIKSFTVNTKEDATVTDFTSALTLKWLVKPKGATVTITASPSVTSTSCSLPSSQASKGVSETLSCTVSADTTFTLTAKSGSTSLSKVATVKKQSGVSADLKITSDGWALPGEEIDVTVEPTGASRTVSNVAITDATETDGSRSVGSVSSRTTQRVRVPSTGDVRVSWECQGCDVKKRDTVAVNVMQLKSPQILDEKGATPLITKVATVPINKVDTVLYGAQRKGYASGTAYIFKEKGGRIDIDFGPKLLAVNSIGMYLNLASLENMRYPVGAIGADSDGERIYAGIAGALMYSEDGGKQWGLLEYAVSSGSSEDPYPGSHLTCAGETQGGVPATGDNERIAMFHQYCDIYTFSESNNEEGIMVATDRGVFTLDDVNTRIKNRKDKKWRGIPATGAATYDGEYLIFTRVANDLEAAGTTIFVATSKGSGTADGGVFFTDDYGTNWYKAGLRGKDVYALAYDSQSKKLYAGTKDSGVLVADVSIVSKTQELTWTAVGSLSKPAYSLAIDPYTTGGLIIAGTDDGIYVLRDTTKGKWTALSSTQGTGDQPNNKVRALSLASKVDKTKGTIQHSLAIGTAQGALSGNVTVSTASASAGTGSGTGDIVITSPVLEVIKGSAFPVNTMKVVDTVGKF